MSDDQRESDLDAPFESAGAPELNNVAETNEKLAEAHSGTECLRRPQAEPPSRTA